MSAPDEKRPPAVADGELVYTSVSAMQKADPTIGCTAQWRFKYVERLPDKPPGKGQKRGTEGHKRVEVYLKTGNNILDPLELKGLPFMPEPNVRPDGSPHPLPVLVEEHFGLPTPLFAQGVPMTGYMDLVDLRRLASEGVIAITDWKFKKSIRLYGAHAKDLIDPNHEAGIQMIGYAAWVAAALPRLEKLAGVVHDDSFRIELRHVTFQTEGESMVVPVRNVLTLQRAAELWETVSRRIVPAMHSAAKASSPHDVPKNKSICRKYGGCAYQNVCLSRMSRIASRITQFNRKKREEMGMLSQVLNGQTIQTGSPIPPPPPAQAPAAQAKTKFEVKDIILAKNASAGARYMVSVDGSGPQIEVTFIGMTKMGEADYATFKGDTTMPFVVSPEKEITAVKAAPAAQAAPAVQAAPSTITVPGNANGKQVLEAAATLAKATGGDVDVQIADAPKRSRGRPKKDGTPAQPTIQSASSETEDPKADLTGVFIFVGCTPLGVATKSLTSFAEAVEKITLDAAYGDGDDRPLDIRCCADSAMGFGKWKGYFEATAKTMSPGPGNYAVTYGDERVEAIARVLAAALEGSGRAVMGGGAR